MMNIKRFIFFMLSIIGLFTPTDVYSQEIKNINENTPVILQHSYDFQNDRNAFIAETKATDNDAELSHYSHYSHSSHYSHTSHRSHTSHTSHRSHYSSRY